MRRLMMRMVAPRQGEQHIDIGQCNQNPSSSRHRRTLAGSMGGVSLLTIMTGSPLRTVRRTPTMENALRNASPTNSSTVLPCAAAASVACWYNSSSTVSVDTQVTPSLSKPHPSTGALPSPQTNVKRLPSPVDRHDAPHPRSVHSPSGFLHDTVILSCGGADGHDPSPG
jgi:hypothetical protein